MSSPHRVGPSVIPTTHAFEPRTEGPVARTIDRILGPYAGSRLGPGRPDADAEAAERNAYVRVIPPFRLFAQLIYSGAGAMGLLSSIFTSLFADPLPAYRPALVAIPALLALAAGLAIGPLWHVVGQPPWVIHGLLGGGTILVAIVVWGSGPVFAPFGAYIFVWVALGAVIFLMPRATALYLVAIGVIHGYILSVLEPSQSPVSRWMLVQLTCVVTCVCVDTLNRRTYAVAAEEAESRREAELARATAEEAKELFELANDRLERSNEDLGRLNTQLEEASQHKSEFLASMSHELRTPLNAVIGFSDVLLTGHFGDLNETQREYVDDIRVSGRHLLALINDVLDLSKVEAGRLEIEPTVFALEETIRSSINLVGVRAAEAGITMIADVGPGAAEAFGDERRIKQVLVNLLNNAVKFTPPGGKIHVITRSDGNRVVVAVRDTGVGIAAEDQAAVFEDFRQVGSAELAREGTGLGLALAKRFLELHGGDIWVESELGHGATFTFVLPNQLATAQV